jgi:hypothetical protein
MRPPFAVSIVLQPEPLGSRKFNQVSGMAKLIGLSGPYSLTSVGVSNSVTVKSPGAYALGKLGEDGIFYIDYVGRSDDDVAARLQQHVTEYYPQFMFGYFPSAKAAFDKECQLYHDFTPPKNKVHPARTKGANWSCPVCTIFD